MIPLLYEANTTTFNKMGLGFLPSWTNIEVVEERNGEFYLQGELPLDGLHVDQLAIERIILAAPAPGKNPQPFRIQKLSKSLDSETVQVMAPHVSYQLSETAVMTYGQDASLPTYSTAQAALNQLLSTTSPDLSSVFTLSSDITPASSRSFGIRGEPVSLRAALSGVEGSMVDTFGGELEWDLWTVRLLASRGSVTDKKIRYAQNMESLSYETDVTGLVTGYIGFYSAEDSSTIMGSVVLTSNASDYAYPRIMAVNLTDKFPDSVPTKAQVTAATQSYCNAQQLHVLSTSIKVTVVPDDFQDVQLCDTVTVVHPGYGLKQQAKVVATVFDPVKEWYKEITVGQIEVRITDTIAALLRK